MASCDGGSEAAEPATHQSVAVRPSKREPVVVVAKDAKPAPFVLTRLQSSGDEGAALQEMHAISAWSAVHQRHRLLGRRGEVGCVFGTLVEIEGTLRLVDENTGQGALAIAVRLPENSEFPLPQRVVIEGAWTVASEQWIWQANAVQGLSESDSNTDFDVEPGLEPRKEPPPRKIFSPSGITREGAIAFRVLRPPKRAGDGWLIADDFGGPAVARLLLPGEKVSYGNQSAISVDEQWKLERGKRYWVEIRRFRARILGVIPTFHATSLPSVYRGKSLQTKQN
ncbi:MAG: hypothetical protein JKY56_05240 [Kofleriaceae bacterium]|nr:hypothetical protein [Kofleriaceae bacterium]